MQWPLFLLALAWSSIALQDERLSARAPANDLISASWYASWHSNDFPLSRVSWDKYTHVAYAFAITTPNPPFVALDVSDRPKLTEFVSRAQDHNVTASLSIGGWTGSRFFSTAVGSARNRTTFVNAVLDVVQEYDLDGIDFDWEYPGVQGLGCNVVNGNDTSNFLRFLRELRGTPVGRDLVLSAAVYVEPFNDASGVPSTNLTGFAEVFDYIVVMNYDVKVNEAIGANSRSPLDDRCAPAGAKWGSAVTSIEAWNKAGFPLEILVLGVPAHGHSYAVTPAVALSRSNSSQLNAYPSYSPRNRKRGDRWDGEGGTDVCGVTWGPGGVYTYWGLMEEGFLERDGSTSEGIAYRYDDCSETPFVYNPDTQVYVSYENPRSYAAKGDFIHSTGLRGFAIWEAGGDYNDTLLDSIREASLNGNPGVRTEKPSIETTNQATPGNGRTSPDSSSTGNADLASSPPFAFLFALVLTWTVSTL